MDATLNLVKEPSGNSAAVGSGADSPSCNCASIGADPTVVRLCPNCHRYWRGDRRLTAVSKILRATWPIPPSYDKADPAVIENARERGEEVDRLFSLYVIGGLDRIPKGTRQDAVELFFKLRRWWNGRKHGEVKSQVILADDEIAGTCDVLDGDAIYDVKATYAVEKTYPLQVAAYAELHFATFQRPVKKLGIIHVTKRFPEPKLVHVDMVEALQDWAVVRQFWKLIQRHSAGKDEV